MLRQPGGGRFHDRAGDAGERRAAPQFQGGAKVLAGLPQPTLGAGGACGIDVGGEDERVQVIGRHDDPVPGGIGAHGAGGRAEFAA